MMVDTEAWDCWAVSFLVNPAILRRFVSRVSQNGSRSAPRATAISEYNVQVLTATVVRKLAS